MRRFAQSVLTGVLTERNSLCQVNILSLSIRKTQQTTIKLVKAQTLLTGNRSITPKKGGIAWIGILVRAAEVPEPSLVQAAMEPENNGQVGVKRQRAMNVAAPERLLARLATGLAKKTEA